LDQDRFEIDTDDLAENEATEPKELVAKAGLDKHQASTPSSARPDAFNYRITVSNHQHTQTSISSDAEMREELSPLIDWLSERATGNR
jgi:hypothetical protein